MSGRKFISGIFILTGALSCVYPASIFAFTSVQKFTVSASVLVGGGAPTGTPAGVGQLVIQAASLPGQAFFGKNVVIPVTVTSHSGRITPQSVHVNLLYWLAGANGGLLSPTVAVPISFVQDPSNPFVLHGTAIVQASDLTAIQHGGRLQYIFQAPQGGSSTLLTVAGTGTGPADILAPPASAFGTEIIDQICQEVGAAGARVSAPDLFEQDGQTAVTLGPRSVAGPGTLCIKQEDPSGWPPGPGSLKPVAIYTITLSGTSLTQTAQLALSYPADVNGQVQTTNSSPNDLSIFWLGPEGLPSSDQTWHPLAQAQLDSTLHTVTALTSHFSVYALFASGPPSNAALRPPQRIITPNGDHHNDEAVFGFPIDEVKIFDMRGRRIKTIPGPSPVWDGTNDSGAIVESGVYLYQFTAGGDRVSGVIAVAK